MTTNKTTVTWWHEVTTLNDHQSEKLNGGSGFLSVAVNGGLGAVEINKSNGAQINLTSEHGKLRYRSFRSRHGHSNHYFF